LLGLFNNYTNVTKISVNILVSIKFIVIPEGDFRPIQKNIHTFNMLIFDINQMRTVEKQQKYIDMIFKNIIYDRSLKGIITFSFTKFLPYKFYYFV
jgi:hypothetical protein